MAENLAYNNEDTHIAIIGEIKAILGEEFNRYFRNKCQILRVNDLMKGFRLTLNEITMISELIDENTSIANEKMYQESVSEYFKNDLKIIKLVSNKLIKPCEKQLLKQQETDVVRNIQLQKIILGLIVNVPHAAITKATSNNGVYIDTGDEANSKKIIKSLMGFYPELKIQELHASATDNRIGVTTNSLFNAIYEEKKKIARKTALEKDTRETDSVEVDNILNSPSMFDVSVLDKFKTTDIYELLNDSDPQEALKPLLNSDTKITLLHLAAESGNFDLFNFIHELYETRVTKLSGKMIYVIDEKGRTPIHLLASKKDRAGFYEKLVTKFNPKALYENLISTDSYMNTPAHQAAAYSDRELVAIFYNIVPSIFDSVNNNGMTPMHLAVLKKNTDVVGYLSNVLKWQTLSVKDLSGRSVFDLAKEIDYKPVLEALETKTANITMESYKSMKPVANENVSVVPKMGFFGVIRNIFKSDY